MDIWIKANTFETGMLERIRSKALRGEGASHASLRSQEDEKGYYRSLIHHLDILCCICCGKDQFTEIISIICIPLFSLSCTFDLCVYEIVAHTIMMLNRQFDGKSVRNVDE